MSPDSQTPITFGRLTALVREPDDSVKDARTIILAHGLGANAWDLTSVAYSIDPRQRFRWIFPNAPVSLAHLEQNAAGAEAVHGSAASAAAESDGHDSAGAPGDGAESDEGPRDGESGFIQGTRNLGAAPAGSVEPPADPSADSRPEVGRAWFPFDPREILSLIFGDYLGRVTEQRPASLGIAGMFLLDLVSEVERRYGADPSNLVLGGFSQGAMVAVEAVFQAKFSPAGLVVLSGALIDRGRWESLARAYGSTHAGRAVRYFQSHGTADPLLQFGAGRELSDLLTTAGFVGEFHPFPGGHWIPEEILWNLSEMLFDL